MIISRFVGRKVVVKLGLLSLLTVGTFAQPYRLVVVDGMSMMPTYADKSTHFAMHTNGPFYRGEVVVLNSPVGTIVKRIALMPGDHYVQIKMGNSWVYAGTMYKKHTYSPGVRTRTRTILPDQMFVLGDNFAGSIDSTTFGPVPMKNIVAVLADQKPRIVGMNNDGSKSWSTATNQV